MTLKYINVTPIYQQTLTVKTVIYMSANIYVWVMDMARRRPVEVRVSALEKAVKKNTKAIKGLDKRVSALETAFSKELANIHEELMKTMFESFGFVPPTEIGKEADKFLAERMKKEVQGEET